MGPTLEESSGQRIGPWPFVTLICLAAGVVPGWILLLPESAHSWAFAGVAAIAVASVVMSVRSSAPTWVKVAATILGAVAAWIAVMFAGLNFMKHGI